MIVSIEQIDWPVVVVLCLAYDINGSNFKGNYLFSFPFINLSNGQNQTEHKTSKNNKISGDVCVCCVCRVSARVLCGSDRTQNDGLGGMAHAKHARTAKMSKTNCWRMKRT